MIGLYELLDPTTKLIEPPGPLQYGNIVIIKNVIFLNIIHIIGKKITIPLAVNRRRTDTKCKQKINQWTNMNYEILHSLKWTWLKTGGDPRYSGRVGMFFFTNWCTQSLSICRPSVCHDHPRQPNLECHGCCRVLSSLVVSCTRFIFNLLIWIVDTAWIKLGRKDFQKSGLMWI